MFQFFMRLKRLQFMIDEIQFQLIISLGITIILLKKSKAQKKKCGYEIKTVYVIQFPPDEHFHRHRSYENFF